MKTGKWTVEGKELSYELLETKEERAAARESFGAMAVVTVGRADWDEDLDFIPEKEVALSCGLQRGSVFAVRWIY